MRNKYIALLFLLLTLILSGCSGTETQKIKIAVMGDPESFYPGYKYGIERAIEDLNKEYADSGYSVECEFYSDNGSYEEGAVIVDKLAGDRSVTAVIGAIDMEINRTAAYAFNEAGKLFVVPFFLYEDVYYDNNYNAIFSMSNSAQTIGETLCIAAAQTDAKRWVLCAADNEFDRSEMNGFLKLSQSCKIQVVDCVNIMELKTNFDGIYKRWETLGVEGVIMFPNGSEGFEILKELKRRDTALICGGDTAFDNSSILNADEELLQAMVGFIMSEEFVMREGTDEEYDLAADMRDEYVQKTGEPFDTWFIHGYNAARMIGDTAIRNKTKSAEEIARILREDGYKGLLEEFYFDKSGSQITSSYTFCVFDETGYPIEHEIEK